MKKIIIATFLTLALLFVGSFFFSSTSHADAFLTSSDPSTLSDSSLLAQKFINQINLLSRVDLSGAFFQDKAFMSLQDYSQPLPDEAIGRDNPFAPF